MFFLHSFVDYRFCIGTTVTFPGQNLNTHFTVNQKWINQQIWHTVPFMCHSPLHLPAAVTMSLHCISSMCLFLYAWHCTHAGEWVSCLRGDRDDGMSGAVKRNRMWMWSGRLKKTKQNKQQKTLTEPPPQQSRKCDTPSNIARLAGAHGWKHSRSLWFYVAWALGSRMTSWLL